MVEIVLPANHADTTIEISSSTDLHVPRAAFVDSAGAPVTEPVVIEVQEILNPVETFLAGIPMALDSGRVLKSAGMFDIQGRTASGDGIASGKTGRSSWSWPASMRTRPTRRGHLTP